MLRHSNGPALSFSSSSVSSTYFHHIINQLLGVYIGSLVADVEEGGGGGGGLIGAGGAEDITGTTCLLPITSPCLVPHTHHTHSIPT